MGKESGEEQFCSLQTQKTEVYFSGTGIFSKSLTHVHPSGRPRHVAPVLIEFDLTLPAAGTKFNVTSVSAVGTA